MSVDRTTDAISHFIGLFQIEVEQARLRDAYEEFTALRARLELDFAAPLDLRIPTDFELDPGKFGPLNAPKVPEMSKDLPQAGLSVGSGVRHPTHGPPSGLDESSPELLAWPQASPQWILPAGLPGSVVTITVQKAILGDADLLGTGLFRDVSGNAADLSALAGRVEALHAPALAGRFEIPDHASAEDLAAAMRDFAPEAGQGVTLVTLHGTEAGPKIVNGEAVEEVPLWKELLPAYHAAQDMAEDENVASDAISKASEIPAWALPESYTPDHDMPEGHSLVTGGNMAVNEASVIVSWLDAPMIALGGAWIDLDIVSQVAALSDRDGGAARPVSGDTALFQTIEITQEARPAPWREGTEAAQGAAPVSISLDVITGDVVVSNHIEQVIEILDDDHFGMAITGANAAYILGDNTVFNATGIVQAGFAYDLILISGDFVSVNTIHQTMVLMDDDWFAPGLLTAAGSVPEKTIVTDGTAASGTAGSQDGLAGLGAAADLPKPEDEAPAWDPASDNLMVNEARLTKVGEDSHAEISDSLAAILAGLDDDHDMLAEKLMNDPALAGIENARVLVIDGDLVQSTTIEQTLTMSDRDDIRIDGTAPPELDLVAGSNALLNAASITEQGVDSVVMAHHEPYSDLLLHQASLIDAEETVPEGLASEAVAFLMERSDATFADQVNDGASATTTQTGTDAYDVMHGVLA